MANKTKEKQSAQGGPAVGRKLSDIFFGKADKVWDNIRLFLRFKKFAKISEAEKAAAAQLRAKLAKLYETTDSEQRTANSEDVLLAEKRGAGNNEKISNASAPTSPQPSPYQGEGDVDLVFIPLSEIAKNSTYSKNYINYSARQGKLQAKKIGGVWHTTEVWLSDFTQKSLAKKNIFKEKLSHDLGGNKKFSEEKENILSLRGAKRRSNPVFSNFASGLLRFARNDKSRAVFKNIESIFANIRVNVKTWFRELGEMEGSMEASKLRKAKLADFWNLNFAKPAAALIALVLLMAVGNITKADLGYWGDRGKKKIYLTYNSGVEAAAKIAGSIDNGAEKSVVNLKVGKEKFAKIAEDYLRREKIKEFEKDSRLSLTGDEESAGEVAGVEAPTPTSSTSPQPSPYQGEGGRVLAAATDAGQTNIGDIEVSAYLMDGENEEITNGEYDVRFGIYTIDRTEADPYPSDADRGSRVWEETQKVYLENGLLKTYLGKTTPVPANLNFAASNYYIGVRIGEDAEMVPRKRIGAVPLARTAMNIAGQAIGNGAGNIPLSNGTLNANLNADTLDGKHASAFMLAGTTLTGDYDNYASWKLQSSAADAGQKIKSNKGAIFAGADGITTSRILNTLTISLDPAASPTFTGITLSGLVPGQPIITGAGGELATEQYLSVTRGGTGAGSFTQYGVLYGNGTSALQVTAAGAEGEVLVSHAGAAPTWEATAPGAAHDILSASHSDTTAAAVQRGDLMTGQGAAASWTRLAAGGANMFLRSDGTDLAWSAITLGTNTTGNYVSTITGTANEIDVSNPTGDITVSLPSEVYLGAFGKLGRDADNLFDFSVDNQITARVNGTDELTLNGTTLYPAANLGLSLGDDTHRFQDLFLGASNLHIGTDTTDEYTIGYDTGTNQLGFNVNGAGDPEIVMDSNGYLGIGTTSPSARLTLQGTNSEATLGAEMITNVVDQDFSGAGNWSTGTGTWSIIGGAWSHSAGANATTLDNAFVAPDPVVGNTYQITFTVNTTTAGTLTPNFGGTCMSVGQSVETLVNYTCVITAYNTNPLSFTPNAAWVGTIDDISVKQITFSNALAVLNNSDGTAGLEMRSGGSGDYNSFIGSQAGMSNTTGQYNSALGSSSLKFNTSGFGNSAVGYAALFSNTTGYNNSALGRGALSLNTTGTHNSAVGFEALNSNRTGTHNLALGAQTLYSNTTGSGNSAVGVASILRNTTGFNNSAVGYYALYFNTTGSKNTALGDGAGAFNSTGSNNTFIGSGSGAGSFAQSNSDNNTLIGYQSGYVVTTGSNNVMLGYGSGDSVTSAGNLTLIGYQAGQAITTTSARSTFLGYQAGYANTSGADNTLMGYTTGDSLTTGASNTLIGSYAGQALSTNGGSTMLGYYAGYLTTGANNILLGYRAGDNITTGASNILLGYDIDTPDVGTSSYLSIGNLIFATGGFGTGNTIGAGDVGIGTSTPGAKLEINGNLKFTGAGSIYTGDATDLALNAGTSGEVNIAGTSTGNVNLAGGAAAFGCTVDNTTGDLVCSGDITGGGTGTIGYWTRTGTVLSPQNAGDTVAVYANTSNTSGTLFDISYTGDPFSLTGELVGAKVDLNDGHVIPTNQNVTGVRVVLPTTTNTNGIGTTITYNGMSLGYGVGTGINQNGAGATVYNGASLLMPALTQTLGTLTANGVLVTTSSSITTAGTANGVNIAAIGVGAGSLNGVNISAITGSGGTERAIAVGSGWDSVLTVNGSTVVNGSGVVPATAGGTGLTTYSAGDLIYADTATSFTNLVAGVGNNGKVLVVSAGVPTWGVMDGSACTDCVLNDPTSVTTQTIQPAADISSLIIREATGGLTAGNIFEVGPAGTPYFYIDKDGNVSTGGTASETLTLTPLSDTTALTLVGTNVPTAALQYINSKNTQGTIFNLAYGGPGATTLAAALTGQAINLATNVTADDQSVTGISITLPTPTNTTSTSNYKGLAVTGSVGAGINQNDVGTTVFSGVDVAIPALTQTAGSLTGNGILVTTPTSITTGGTANGISIAATGVGAGSLYGVNISNLAGGAGAAAETGLYIGTGWDFGVYSATAGANYFAGNVGIGTTDPSYALSVSDGTDQLGLLHDGTDAYFKTTDGNFIFQTDEAGQNTILNIKPSVGSLNQAGKITFYGTTGGGAEATGGSIYGGNGGYLALSSSSSANINFVLSSTGDVNMGSDADSWVIGSTSAEGDLYLAGTNNATAGDIFLNPVGGNVGIGTTAPGDKLEVNGNISLGGQAVGWPTIKFQNSGSDVYLYGTDSLFLVDNSSGGGETLAVNVITGRVGIGTTAPSNKLHIEGTAAGSAGIFMNDAAPGTTTTTLYNSGGDLFWDAVNLTGGGALPGGTEGQMLYNNNGAWTAFDGMFWDDTTSRLGIGTTSPGALLHMEKNQNALSEQYLVNTTSGTSAGTTLYLSEESNPATKYGSLFHLNSGFTTNGVLQASGTYLVSGDTNGLWLGARNAAGIIHFYTGGVTADSERMTILSGGNVGIGTTNPGAKLNVVSTNNAYSTESLFATSLTQSAATGTAVSGNIASVSFNPTYSTAVTNPAITGNVLNISRSSVVNTDFASTLTVSGAVASFSDSATQTQGTLASTADVVRIAQNYSPNTGAALNITSAGSFALRVNDNGNFDDSTPFVVDGNGNVGIGTTSPLSKLHVNGGTGTLATGLVFGDGDTGFWESADDAMEITVGNTQSWNITSSMISGNTAGSAGILNSAATSIAPSLIPYDSDPDTGIGHAADNVLSLISGGTNVLNTNSSGYVGIGTTNPQYNLHLTGSPSNYIGYFYNTSTNAAAGGLYIRSDGTGSLLTLNYNGSNILDITPAQSTFSNPVNFLSSGDVSIAYDLYMTNTTAGYIKFNGPGYIQTESASENLDLTLSAANEGYVVVADTLQLDMVGIGTTAATQYGYYGTVSDTGVVTTGTDTTYGNYLSVTRTGATGGTINTYGQYIGVVADNAGAGGTSTAYGLYVDTTGSTADTTYNSIFMGGNVGIGTTSPGARLQVNQSGAATAANYGASIYNTSTSSTDSINKYGLYISSTGTWNGLSGATNYGLYVDAPTGGTANTTALFAGSLGNVSVDGTGAILGFSRSGANYITASGASGSLGLQTGGSNTRLNIDSSGNVAVNTSQMYVRQADGYVGIGTTSPLARMHVDGGTGSLATGLAFGDGDTGFWESSDDNMRITVNGTAKWQIIEGYLGSVATNGAVIVQGPPTSVAPGFAFSGDDNTGIGRAADNVLSLISGGTNVLNTNSSGYVGIGTTNPTSQLTINAANTSAKGINLQSNGTTLDWEIMSTATDRLFSIGETAGANRFVIDRSGNVGIGTTAPEAPIHIVSSLSSMYQERYTDTAENGAGLLMRRTRGTPGAYSVVQDDDHIASLSWAAYSGAAGDFAATARIRAYIDAEPDTAGDPTDMPGRMEFMTVPDGSSGVVTRMVINNAGSIQFNAYGAGTLTTDASGNITASSDERLKNVTGSFSRGLTDIMGIDPISYFWKTGSGLDTQNEYSGFSAQNVRDFIPEAIDTDPRGYLTLSDRPILAAAVNAIQEQQGAIGEQGTMISDQQNRIANYELQITSQSDNISGLQTAVNDKLNIVSNSLTALDSRMATNETETANLKTQLASAETRMIEAENDLASFRTSTNDTLTAMLETDNLLTQKITDHESRLQYLEAKLSAMTIVAGEETPANVITVGQDGNASLAGIFEAKEVVAGAYKVKNEDPAHRTMGDAKINADESEKKVETSAISDTAKVFVTFEGDPGARYWVEKTAIPGTAEFSGFVIKLSEPAQADVDASWWVVDER